MNAEAAVTFLNLIPRAPHRTPATARSCSPMLAALFLFTLFAAPACTMRIAPPREVADPTNVYIADYGRHASLLLPADEGGFVEFAYGQWDWFALERNRWYNALYLMMFPAQGTLGMRRISDEISITELRSELGAESLYTISVDRSKAKTLHDDLLRSFEDRRSSLFKNLSYRMDFVRSSITYSMWTNNCNTVLADWLTRLGCRVTGSREHANFKIDG